MNNNKKSNFKDNIPKSKLPKGKNQQTIFILILLAALLGIMYFKKYNAIKRLPEANYEKMLKAGEIKSVDLILNKKIIEITIKEKYLENIYNKEKLQTEKSKFSSKEGPHYYIKIPSMEVFDKNFKELQKKLPEDQRISYETKERFDLFSLLANWSGLIFIGILFWIFLRKMPGSGGGSGGLFSIGKSKAILVDPKGKDRVIFNDVAGLREAKEELKEIVEFLKFPKKFTNLGAKIPKGALLIGPPGTGKTLLAKAVAGEAGVPFLSLSGSDFVEMFVGIGAARVRDTFKVAKSKAPCIIFIDEIDAVARSRANASMPGSNDERENTLNALLVEMDGFGTDSGVIILAATNRPEILDQALLRPGRFDRQISIDRPNLIEREDIFKVHMKKLKVSKKIKASKLAEQTPGFAGAEIANVCNEAALIAARKNKKNIEIKDFQDAIDRIIGGLEKKDKVISPKEKRIVAYHEAGHAVSSWFLEHADPLVKVTIVPRGYAALGYAQYLPNELFLIQYEKMLDEICVALGGRAAEEIILGKISTGALSDLETSTKRAYAMVQIYGMSEKIGHVTFYDSQKDSYFTKPYSESTNLLIDEEVRKIITDCYQRTISLLREKKNELEIIAQELLKREVIFKRDVERLIGPRPFEDEVKKSKPKLIPKKDANKTEDKPLNDKNKNNNNPDSK
ncbi:MAG: ATP-dependent zinc metalloprotease FtsH [Bacteroidetes bacterium]|nr:ATP-dependent zinc metalloprotease FtsH [Bacteroidota bacterium]